MSREEGFYWVRRSDAFEVGAWFDGVWSLAASHKEFDGDDFEWIGERIPEPETGETDELG